MSNNSSSAGHDVHAPSAGKKVSTLALLVGLPLLIVIGLVGYYKAQSSGEAASSMSDEAIAARLQKVGSVSLGEANREPRTGEEVFNAQCGTCHTAGLLGAPKFGDKAAWAPRIGAGYEALLQSALKGKNNMTPQGGGAFSDYEVGRALVYMANAGGAKFDEPKAPEAAK